jgi:hypothetical protein
MAITYEVSEYQVGDKTAEMIFTDDNGLVHKRQVNIPYIDENTIDEDYLQEIFEGQLRGVQNKVRVNAVTFIDPTDIIPPETIEPTEEETSESLNDSKDLISEP